MGSATVGGRGMRQRLDAGIASYADYQSRRYFPVLDGLRAVAILLVFTAHTDDQRWLGHLNGGVGVTIFFVLSGYLITTLSLREEQRSGRLDVRAFYIRRVFRIAPVYILILAFYCVLIIVMGYESDRHDVFVDQLPYYAFGFPEHGHFFLINEAAAPPFAGAWSIGIEEKFYLLWPLIGFVLLSGAFLWRAGLCVLAAAACAVAPYVFRDGAYIEPYVGILIGCTVALLLQNPRTFTWCRWLASTPVFAGSVVAFALVLFAFFPEDHPRNVYVVTVLLLGLAMFGLVLRTSGAVNWLAWRPVVFVGEISYVFYLVHTFAINAVEDSGVNPFDGPSSVLVTVALALPIAIIGSYVVHRIVELPFIAIGRRLGHRDASQMHSVS